MVRLCIVPLHLVLNYERRVISVSFRLNKDLKKMSSDFHTLRFCLEQDGLMLSYSAFGND